MPPKKKDSAKKPAKARTPTLIDGLTKEEMSKEQLEEHIVRLREELDREREERNYFQLERDKIHSLWNITEKQLQALKADLDNLDNDIEKDERRHQVEIKVNKQKVKHLLCEHANTISELKADGVVSTEKLQKEQEQLELGLHEKRTDTLTEMQQVDKESFIKDLELRHANTVTMTRNNLEEKVKDLINSYEKRLQMLQEDMETLMKNVTIEREHQWNSHIAALKENHDNTMSGSDDIVNLMEEYLDATIVIQREIKEVKMNKRRMEENMDPISQDNKCLVELISKVNEDIAEAEKKIKYFKEAKIVCEIIEKDKNKKLKDLKFHHKILEEKFNKLQQEVGELYKTFAQTVPELQHRADEEVEEQKKKLDTMTERVEKTHAQLCSVLSASNMDHTALTGITKKMEEKLDSANSAIKHLQHKRKLISRARRDLLLSIEAKEGASGVPVK